MCATLCEVVLAFLPTVTLFLLERGWCWLTARRQDNDCPPS
jgi:hypothetical protein